MGQGNDKALSQQQQIQKQYIIQSRLKQQNLTFLTHRQNNKSYVLRELIYNQEISYNHYLNQISNFKAINSPRLTRFVKQEHFKQECLCSKYFRIYLLWEYPKNTLAAEINSRALEKRPFAFMQIRKILNDVCQAMLTLKRNEIPFNYLTTKNIFIDALQNIKIINPNVLHLTSNLQTIYKQRNIKNIYLSPQQCHQIQNQYIDFQIQNQQKSNIYIMGIIMLQICLLERQQQCYLDQYSRINQKAINYKLRQVQLKYGLEMKMIICQMVQFEIQRRVTWDRLVLLLGGNNSNRLKNSMHIKSEESWPLKSFQSESYKYQSKEMYREIPQLITPRMSNNGQPKINWISTPSKNISINYPPLNHQIIQPKQSSLMQRTPLIKTQPKTPPPPLSKIIRFNYQPNHDKTISKPLSKQSQQKRQTSGSQNSLNPNQKKKTFELSLREPIYVIDEISQNQKYEGYKFEGKRQGEGKFFLNNKICYDGLWRKDLMNGQGKLFYQSGAIAYQGTFQNDQFHNKGILYNEYPTQLTHSFNFNNFDEIQQNWLRYQGQFNYDQKQGCGRLYLTNGQIFDGSFRNDLIDGLGSFIDINGKINVGYWSQNKFVRFLQ